MLSRRIDARPRRGCNRATSAVLAGVAVLLVGSSAGAKQTAEKCAAAKDVAAQQLAAARLACLRTALLANQAVTPSCVAKAEARFLAKMEKIAAKGGCRAGGDATTIEAFVGTLTDRLEGVLAAAPTQGALRLTFEIYNSGVPVTCDAVNGATGIEVDLTPQGAGTAISRSLSCGPSQGDVTGIPFGTYLMSVSILNSQQQALAQSVTQQVTFDATCDVLVGGDCGKLLNVVLSIL